MCGTLRKTSRTPARKPKLTKRERETSKELDKAADVYDDLLTGADSINPTQLVSPFEPQTILAMIDDPKYAAKVKKRHKTRYPTDE